MKLSSIFSFLRSPQQLAVDDYRKDKKKRISYSLRQQRLYYGQIGQDMLKAAVAMAEDPHNPRRYDLIMIYRQIMKDFHLRSQIRTACNKVIAAPAAVVKKGTNDIDKDATKLLQKKWFEDICRLFLEAEFWGHSLVEFGQLIENTDKETSKLAPFVFDCAKVMPREHVNPAQGLVHIDPTSSEGIPYRQEPFSTWLLEAGDPDDLGLLEVAAIYSIYKRYSLSDWSRSGEKWGDPLLVIKSSQDDDTENAKKEEFARNFGNNGYIITDDQDEVEIKERSNDKGYQIFLDFLKYLDGENSKGINGQTGTSDEKAFVGSANVHERLLEEYTVERLRSLMYWINEKALPFLIGKGYRLEDYEWRPLEFMRELTVPGTEPPPPPTQDPKNPSSPGGATQPKKSLNQPVSRLLSELYVCGCGAVHLSEIALSVVPMPNIIERALKRLYDRKVKAGDVDAELVKATTDEWYKAIAEGWKTDIQNAAYGSAEHLIYLQMRYNVAITALFKNHTHNVEVLRELFDEQGNIRTWSKFKKAALAISKKYNVEYLKAEYQTAEASARMAKKWQEYSQRGGKIKYMTIGDGRVREEHRVLDGIVKPVGDAFWNNYWPPNGWRCRCYVRWMSEDEPDVEPTELPAVKPPFLGNVGKSGEIFNAEHPYFDPATGSINPTRIKLPISPEQLKANVELFKSLIRDPSYKLVAADNQNGGFVFAHILADAKDLATNKTVGNILAGEGYAVEIREHINLEGVKNPELRIGEVLADVKSPLADRIEKTIYNAFVNARKQGLTVFVAYIEKPFSDTALNEGLREGFRRKSIQKVIIIHNNKVVEVTRTDYEEDYILERLKGLK